METRLLKALSANTTLDELTQMCQEFLERVSGLQEEIGPPFYFATITRAGYRSVKHQGGRDKKQKTREGVG